MTTRVTIKNEGPDLLMIRFYNAERQFSSEVITLQVGESHETNIWDDHLPVCWPLGHGVVQTDGEAHLFAVPPACM